MGEPHQLSVAQALGLTRLQVLYVYLHPRDERGGLVPYGPPRSVAARHAGDSGDAFAGHWRGLGAATWQIERLRAGERERLARVGELARGRAFASRR